jgi:hypothetical protein
MLEIRPARRASPTFHPNSFERITLRAASIRLFTPSVTLVATNMSDWIRRQTAEGRRQRLGSPSAERVAA